MNPGDINKNRSWLEFAGTYAGLSAFGPDALKMQGISDGLGKLEGIIQNILPKVKIGASDFSLFGSINYWDTILTDIKNSNKELGIAGNLSNVLENSFTSAYAKAAGLGITSKELAESIKKYYDETSRSQNLSSEEMLELAKLGKTFGDDSIQIISTFKNLGMGINTSTNRMKVLVKESDKFGIVPSKIMKEMKANVNAIDKITFKNGVKGMQELAIFAAKTNTSMASAVAVADKLRKGGLEGAIEMASGLQLLGGEFSNLSALELLSFRDDPKKLLEMTGKELSKYVTVTKEGLYEISSAGKDISMLISEKIGKTEEEVKELGRAYKKSFDIKNILDSNLRVREDVDEIITKISGAGFTDSLGNWFVNLEKGGKTIKTAVSDIKDIKDLDSLKMTVETKGDPGEKDVFASIIQSNMNISDILNKTYEEIKATSISGGGYEKIYDALSTGSDNIKVALTSTLEQYSKVSQAAIDGLTDVMMPLLGGDLKSAWKEAKENIADTGKGLYNLGANALNDTGDILTNLISNAGKLLSASIAYGFELGLMPFRRFAYDFYDQTMGRIGYPRTAEQIAEAEKKLQGKSFGEIYKSIDFKGVFDNVDFNKYNPLANENIGVVDENLKKSGEYIKSGESSGKSATELIIKFEELKISINSNQNLSPEEKEKMLITTQEEILRALRGTFTSNTQGNVYSTIGK